MSQRMTPAQARAAAQRAQRERQRAVDNYNREVRKHNASVKKSVDDYNRQAREYNRQADRHNASVKKAIAERNREVRNYNSKVRSHNRDVENQRQRLRNEVARMNRRASGETRFVSYRVSTEDFAQHYIQLDDYLTADPRSAINQRFLHLTSDEAANSVYLANALTGDGAPEDDPTQAELQAPSMVDELSVFGVDLVERWTGALYALSPANPDAARHFCTSAREVLTSIIDSSAPDDQVKLERDCELTDRGKVTRRSKVSFLLRRIGITNTLMTGVVAKDMDNVLTLFRTFNDGTHGHAGRFTITELSAIRTRVEAAIAFVHEIVTTPHV